MYLQVWKRSYSAGLSQFLNLTTSKTGQFCETSSLFEVANVKSETILRDFLQKWKVECRADGLVPMRFAIFPLHLSKVLRRPRKVMPDHTKCCTCHAKSPQQTSRSDAPKCNPPRKAAPWPPNSSDEHVSCTAPAKRNASGQIICICSTPAIVFETATKPSRFAHLWQGAQSLVPATRNDIWTSKSAPYPAVFCTFDFEMCFALQRRALFRHPNFQKWSENAVLCTFWLWNVLRATTAWTFSSLIWPAGSAPAALASLLFDPPEPQIIGKTQFFATFLPFRAPGSSFFGDFLFLVFFLLFSSDSSHLCFSSVHIVGSLTSKLPLAILLHFLLLTIYYLPGTTYYLLLTKYYLLLSTYYLLLTSC